MNKRGKKLLSSISVILIVLVVASMFFVVAQTNSNDSTLTTQEKEAIKEKLDKITSKELSNAAQGYIEEFVEKRGIDAEDINNVSEVDFGTLPEEVQIDNVKDANLAIYNVDFNDSENTNTDNTKQVFVVTYSTEKIETTADLIAHPDKRQFLQFGLNSEAVGSSFLSTASGVPGSLEQGYVMMRQGSITGMSTNLNVLEASGQVIEVILYKNGEAISFGNVIDSESSGIKKDFDIQSKGVVTFEPGNTISVGVKGQSSDVKFKDVITMVEITTVE